MKKRRLRIIKYVAIVVAVMVLAWGASAIAVYAVSSGRVFDGASIDAVPRQRAVFTARGFGCDAYGYAAKDVNGRYSIKTTIREQLAKIAAVLDVILRRSPKFLGPREALPGVLKESGSSS